MDIPRTEHASRRRRLEDIVVIQDRKIKALETELKATKYDLLMAREEIIRLNKKCRKVQPLQLLEA